MKHCFWLICCLGIALFAYVPKAPAPLIYTPGEGWRYEAAGSEGGWIRNRASNQLDVAQQAFDAKNYSLATKAARRTVKQWPFSDYAPRAQYLLARCLEEKGKDEQAFKAYQHLLERYPKIENYTEIVQRQFVIANRYLGGQWFKLWGYIPAFPSMDKTIKLYDQIIKNGPYSEVAPSAQMNIAAAHEKKLGKDYPAAAAAYQVAADRYTDRPIGADALYKLGATYQQQAKTAEYDQGVAAQAIGAYSDFVTLHPSDARVTEAQRSMDALKIEQARGNFDTARYYEGKRKWLGAKIYYNAVLNTLRDRPDHPYAEMAMRRIDEINKWLSKTQTQ